VGSTTREFEERHVLGLAVRPGDVDGRWGVGRCVDLRDHEMPLRVIALVIGQRFRADLLGPALRDRTTARHRGAGDDEY
jgi:hypothetical protein